MIWGIIFVSASLFILFTVIKQLWQAVCGVLELRRISQVTRSGIKLEHVFYANKNYMLSILIYIILTAMFSYCYYLTNNASKISYIYNWLKVGFAIGIIEIILRIIYCLLISSYMHNCYLTNSGIVAAEGIYKKEKCRFTISVEQQGTPYEAKFVNVYKGNSQYPLKFKIIQAEEEVIRIISNFTPIY